MSFADLDGESFLVLSQIGFWMEMTRRNLPNAQIVEQDDRFVFEQLARTTDLICFVTNATRPEREREGRVAVPITDADAHATFYLTALADAPDRVRQIVDWVKRSVQ